jgi:hypothetical protein
MDESERTHRVEAEAQARRLEEASTRADAETATIDARATGRLRALRETFEVRTRARTNGGEKTFKRRSSARRRDAQRLSENKTRGARVLKTNERRFGISTARTCRR